MKTANHSLITGPCGLRSENCHCGGRKVKGQAVCHLCYQALPRDVGRALPRDVGRGLFCRVGAGYEEAVEAALKALRAAGRVKDGQ